MTRLIRLQHPAIVLSRALLTVLSLCADLRAAGAVARAAKGRRRAATER